MKLRNKKTGEITETNDWNIMLEYNSLAELESEWEDYEEPKEHWCITMYGGIARVKDDEPVEDLKEIGNYFNSKEEAYDKLDKLKAWKRLKDKGFRFDIEAWENAPLDEIFYEWNEDFYNKEDRKLIEDDMRIVFED